MKIKVALVSLLGLSMIFLMGCYTVYQDSFFGIQIFSSRDIDAFSKVVRKKSGKIDYTYKQSRADPRIHCWGGYAGLNIVTLKIINASKKPVQLNYFADEYRLWTTDGTSYTLEISTDITKYPNVLNPGSRTTVYLKGFNGKLEDIKFIVAGVDYGNVAILLRRIETI